MSYMLNRELLLKEEFFDAGQYESVQQSGTRVSNHNHTRRFSGCSTRVRLVFNESCATIEVLDIKVQSAVGIPDSFQR